MRGPSDDASGERNLPGDENPIGDLRSVRPFAIRSHCAGPSDDASGERNLPGDENPIGDLRSVRPFAIRSHCAGPSDDALGRGTTGTRKSHGTGATRLHKPAIQYGNKGRNPEMKSLRGLPDILIRDG
jgi:hypothetical protein